MHPYTFHINLYDLAFVGAIFIGLTFAVLLWVTKTVNRSANRFLTVALVTMILWMVRVLVIDLTLDTYLPLQFLLVLGPLVYFYVLKITRPQYKFNRRDILHFSPVLLEMIVFVLEIGESAKTGAATWATHTFQLLNPVLQLLIFTSNIIYLYLCNKLIQKFYRGLQPVLMDRSLIEFKWLRRLLGATAVLWLLWLGFAVINFIGYRNQPGVQGYYPFYIFFVVIIIWTAAAAFLKPQAAIMVQAVAPVKQPVPAELRAKGAWLKRTMETNLYYEDPELTLSSLAEKLNMPQRELSRLINTALKKGFNDFINEYRVRYVVLKMQDPANDNITLQGIAYDAGFNSKATFIRAFKQFTGKNPTEYKRELEKQVSIHPLQPYSVRAAVISNHQTTPKWADVKLNRNYMFRNYVKLAFRNIVKDKAYSFLNISGLAIGLASSILILLWVQNERSYDRFHTNAQQIYRITCQLSDLKAAVSPEAIAAGLKAELPVLKNTVRLSEVKTMLFEAGNRKFEEKRVFYADPSFVDVFSFPLVQGSRATALNRADAVLITQNIAVKYFGNQNPVGKLLRKNDNETVVVTGVLDNIPANSDLQFDMILPMAALDKANINVERDKWENFSFYSYIQLDQNFNASAANLLQLEKQIDKVFSSHSPMKVVFNLQPLVKIHLAPERLADFPGHGNAQYVSIFFIVAILILVVACINFMNLATARSARRAKEIGLRKVAGAIRRQLILQFLSESVFISFLSLGLALVIAWLFLPVFNGIADRKLIIPVSDARFWLSLLVIALLTGLTSGSYPALFLSGFNPVKVLKGNVKSMGGNLLFRNALVVTQFAFSIILLVGTVVIYNQLTFIKERNPGFEKANLLYMPLKGDIWNRPQALKDELKQNPLTSEFAITSDLPTNLVSGNISAKWDGKDPQLQTIVQLMDVSEDFIHVFKLKLLSGRSFSPSFPADSNNYIVNEKMLALMQVKASAAVGKSLTFTGVKGTIVGVVKDFNFKPVQQAIEPLILRLNKYGGFVVVRTLPGKTNATIQALANVSKRLNPAYPFTFNFIDQDLANLYKGEQQMGNIFNLFAILGIFISCLGLYGLSAFMAEQRTKEIGVRKVLGASVFSLVYLLSTGITRLIFIAIIIAIPLSWYAVNSWLAGFAYHINVGWQVFFIASLAALGIAWLTLSYVSVKAAIVNPVKSLKME